MRHHPDNHDEDEYEEKDDEDEDEDEDKVKVKVKVKMKPTCVIMMMMMNWLVLIPFLKFPIQHYHTNNNAIFWKCNCKCPKIGNFEQFSFFLVLGLF